MANFIIFTNAQLQLHHNPTDTKLNKTSSFDINIISYIEQMQLPSLPLNIKIQLGQQQKQNQQNLGHIHIANYRASEINKLKEKAKFNEDIGQDIVCLFKYSVQGGRQEQAKAYFQAAINQTINSDIISPLQYITKNPKSHGKVDVYTAPGEVTVCYRFFGQELDPQLKDYVINNVSKFNTLQIDIFLKGFVSHSLKNRANVKVNYAKIHFTSEHADSEILSNIFVEYEFLPPEFTNNPFFNCLGKAKKLNLAVKLRSFREMSRYYDNLMQSMGQTKKQERQDFKYMNQGIFRQKMQAYVFAGNDFVITGNLTHHGQDAFMRLIKVYFKAGKKILD